MKDFGNKEAMAKNLRYYMLQKGVTPKHLSRDIDVPYTTVRSWLKGDNYPRIDKIEILAEYFGIMKSDLIEEANRKIVSKEIDKKTGSVAKISNRMLDDDRFRNMVLKLAMLDEAQTASIEQLLNVFVPDE